MKNTTERFFQILLLWLFLAAAFYGLFTSIPGKYAKTEAADGYKLNVPGITLPLITSPGNPSSGYVTLWPNSATSKLACTDSSGADCMPTASGSSTISTTTWASLPTCDATKSGWMYFLTDSIYSQAYCNGSAWSYFMQTWPQTRVLASSFTSMTNFTNTATISDTAFGLQASGENNQQAWKYHTTAIGATYSVTARISASMPWNVEQTNLGILIYDHACTGTNQAVWAWYVRSAASANSRIIRERFRCDAVSATAATTEFPPFGSTSYILPYVNLRIRETATTRYFEYCWDTYNGNCDLFPNDTKRWRLGYSEAAATSFTPTRVGILATGSTNYPPAGEVISYVIQ